MKNSDNEDKVMADYVSTLGQTQKFQSTGDTVTCALNQSHGVQLSSSGFNLADATIQVQGYKSSGFTTVSPADGATTLALVADGFRLSAVKISGVTVSDGTITFTQP